MPRNAFALSLIGTIFLVLSGLAVVSFFGSLNLAGLVYAVLLIGVVVVFFC